MAFGIRACPGSVAMTAKGVRVCRGIARALGTTKFREQSAPIAVDRARLVRDHRQEAQGITASKTAAQ